MNEYKEIVINLPKYVVGLCCEDNVTAPVDIATLIHAVKGGTPLPEGHGDLIDRDELEPDTEWDNYYDGFTSYSEMQISSAKAIVEVNKESENSKDEKF